MSDQIDIVKRMVRAYNTGDTSAAEEFIHPEYMNPGALEHMPNLRGPESFSLAVQWLKHTFSSDAQLEEVSYEENGSWVRAYLVLYGKQVGPMVGMPATGRVFSGEQIHLIKIVDGKVRDHRDWPDYQGTYRQLRSPWPTAEGWRA